MQEEVVHLFDSSVVQLVAGFVIQAMPQETVRIWTNSLDFQ